MIYLLRHGEIEKGAKGRFIGQLDIPLSEKGREQAKKWSKYLSENRIGFERIYSSDLLRCVETAGIIAGEIKIEILRELREINLGQWDGLIMDEVKRKYPVQWKLRGEDPEYRPPGGESFTEFSKRVIPVMEKISQLDYENILVITHAGVIRSTICHILGMPLERLFCLDQDYSGMNLIDNMKNPLHLVYMNRII